MIDYHRYELVRCPVTDLAAFEKACEQLLNQGWCPVGGIAIHEGYILQAWMIGPK
jgi:hypothetical protein